MVNFSENKKLNKEQLEAVNFGQGPLLVIAGAGTGKTTVITERIKRIITDKNAAPSEILALTFTEKSAREMEERVDQAMPFGCVQMWITTFHAFCERVLRQEAVHIGLDPGFKLMTEAESVLFFRKKLFLFNLNYFRPLGNPKKFIAGILQHFARLKDEDVEPKQYLDWAKSQNLEEKLEIEKYLELANAYAKYEALKVNEGVMDFADLISNTLKLFRLRKNVLTQYQKQFKYFLIDEFQDTNFAQNQLAILLSSHNHNITVVGDDDQAIYRFRGAAVSNIIQFRDNFPDCKIVVLNKNYRSTSEILDTSYRLIQNNNPDRLEVKEKIDKKLTSERKIRGEKVEMIYTERVEDEAEAVATKIKNQKLRIKDTEGMEKYNWFDFAILLRANNHADPFVRAFQRAGVPFQFLGPGMLFRQSEVKDLIAYLKLLNDFEDSVATFKVLSMPILNLAPRDIIAINSFAKRVGISVFEAIEAIIAIDENNNTHWSNKENYGRFIPFLSLETKNGLKKVYQMIIRHLELSRKESAGQILYLFLEDSGLLKIMAGYKTVEEEKVVLNISKFFDKLKMFEIDHENADIASVLDWIDMSFELGESPLAANTDWTENDAVNILTVHSSKGLEFPVVYIVNLVSQRFPTTQRREQIPIPQELVKEILPEGDFHIEEERRIFYVALTRAKDSLTLSASSYYGEGKRDRKISQFMIESLGEEVKTKLENKSVKQLTLLEWKKTEVTVPVSVVQPITYLSYSQIDSFSTCPLQYKYRYILKIPVPTSSAGSFGTSIHAALQKFYERAKLKEEVSEELLQKIYEDVWIPVGYGNREYEKKMKEKGKDMLSNFYKNSFDAKSLPKDLEQIFKIRLTPLIKIGGKIDRVDITKEGKLEIIDYKTGKRPSGKDIQENLQMTVYALAATDEGIYNKKPEDVILSFYFFDTLEKVSSTRTEEQLVEARKKLEAKASEIARSKFEPKTGPWCDFCDFRLICNAWN